MKKKIYKFMMLMWVVALALTACGAPQTVQTPPPVVPLAVDATTAAPVDAAFLDQSYDQLSLKSYELLDEATPRLSQRVNR